MDKPLIVPMRRVTTFLDPVVWHAFRLACLARHTSGSQEIRRLIEEQLAAWQQQPPKDPSHA